MRMKIVWVFIFFLVSFPALAAMPGSGAVWVLPETEKLVFRMKWIGIPAGMITAEIKGIEEIRGRRAYRIEVTARTTGICRALYRIEDRYVSYLDVERLHTLRHEVHRREGGYKKDAVTDFDQERHQAHFKSLTDGSEKTFDIPPDTQDTISAAYVMRTRDLQAGGSYDVKICNSEKNYDIFFHVLGKGVLSVPGLGRREVFSVKPYGHLKGKEVRDGRLSGWISTEPGHVPYRIVIKAPVFTQVTAFLVTR
ncbi:MAG: DUF3108 domain-containing protein [Candidatus Omnitrophica bacterium]|nr:DUF3108 domain-containing protein [Candidatus Omnitrophota bacterium]